MYLFDLILEAVRLGLIEVEESHEEGNGLFIESGYPPQCHEARMSFREFTIETEINNRNIGREYPFLAVNIKGEESEITLTGEELDEGIAGIKRIKGNDVLVFFLQLEDVIKRRNPIEKLHKNKELGDILERKLKRVVGR